METQEMVVIHHDPDADNPQRKDPAWYVDGYGHGLVATVKANNDEYIDIYCDGEMRVNIRPDATSQEWSVVRYCDRFSEHGITTDADIIKAEAEGRLEWVNNAWFDMYQTSVEPLPEMGWLDCVEHNLDDAIEHAKRILSEHMAKETK